MDRDDTRGPGRDTGVRRSDLTQYRDKGWVVSKKRFYAVAVGRRSGIYTEWQGRDGARTQVDGVPGAKYKGFRTRSEAEAWLREATGANAQATRPATQTPRRAAMPTSEAVPTPGGEKRIRVYTDGGCIGNPGAGGYGAVLLSGGRRQELSGGYRLTTNNRMELTACIVALQALNADGAVRLFSDSQYVVRAMADGWAARWRAHGWRRNKREKAENADLWAQLLELCDQREVEFVWVRGHAGHPMNERSDRLAMMAARGGDLPPDVGYEEASANAANQLHFA